MKIEICANSIHSAINAQKGKAHRIELCCNLKQGGLTPSAGTIQATRKHLEIDVFVLIRPRIGDFLYTGLEFEVMLADIKYCKEIGIDGVVFGILSEDNSIDLYRNAILVEAAQPMQTTFHRAFDCIPNPMEGLEQLITLGFDKVLTSGQAYTAIKGQLLIKKLVKQANERIQILPGGGLSADNIISFITSTQVKEIHLSAKREVSSAIGELFEANYFETDLSKVERVTNLF